MPSVQKTLLALFLLTTFLFIPFTIRAASSPPPFEDIDPKKWGARENTGFSLGNMAPGAICLLAPTKDCPITIWENGSFKTKIVSAEGGTASLGAIGTLATLTSGLYQSKPTSSITYLASLSEDFGFPKSAYAQESVFGSGSGIIKPVLKLWQMSRNIAYLFFIVIFLVAGFMIMFRRKLNPQTVITAQAALPGLVIGLIMVTFSYFIAALLVDVAFVGVQLVGFIFANSGMNNQLGSPTALANNSSLFEMFYNSSGAVKDGMGSLFNGIVDLQGAVTGGSATSWGFAIPVIVGGLIGLLAGPIGGLVGAGLGFAATNFSGAVIITGLVSLILLVALFIQLFRLFFGLVNTYLQILIYTILGPFIILFSSIPGRGGAIGGWLKTLIANALVFPAVFAAFMFAGALLGGTTEADWRVVPPLFANLPAELLRVVLAFGIIMGTPAIPGMIRESLGVKGLPGGIDKAALGGAVAGFGAVRAGAKSLGGGLAAERRTYGDAAAKERLGIPSGLPANPPPRSRFWLWGIRR